jgi:hypothetical protein
MKDKTKTKNIRIATDALSIVLQVSNESKRNLTGATEYLILKGFEVYQKELQIINSIKSGAVQSMPT